MIRLADRARSARLPRSADVRASLRAAALDGRLIAGLLFVANLAWVLAQRRGRALDIDEAGYFTISAVDHRAWEQGGVLDWIHTIRAQGIQAPLAPALASVAHHVVGLRVTNIFLVSVVAYGAITAAVHRASRGWPPRARLSAQLLTATSPVLLIYSRSFNFGITAAACLAWAVVACAESRRFSRWVPSMAWGLAVGAMVLARTMTVAFLPGVVLAAALAALGARSWMSIVRLVAGGVTAAMVAATWYLPNWRGVLDYLRSVGYGANAAQYGGGTSSLSPSAWMRFAVTQWNGYFQAGTSIALLTTLAAGAVMLGIRVHQSRRLPIARLTGGGVAVTSAVISITGVLALLSSKTGGSAFAAPLVAPLALVAGRVVSRFDRERVARGWTVAVALLVAPAAVLGFLPVERTVVWSVRVPLPTLGPTDLTLVDSRGTLRTYLDFGGVPAGTGPAVGSREHGAAWFGVNARLVADMSATAAGRHPVVVFTFRHRLVNPNTFMTEVLLRGRAGPGLAMLAPPLPGDTPADVADQVRPLMPSITMVVTATAGPNEFDPPIPDEAASELVERLGFVVVREEALPDGRVLRVWASRSLAG